MAAYLNQISSSIIPVEKTLEANEITKMTATNLNGANFWSCLRSKSLQADLFSLNDDDDDDFDEQV